MKDYKWSCNLCIFFTLLDFEPRVKKAKGGNLLYDLFAYFIYIFWVLISLKVKIFRKRWYCDSITVWHKKKRGDNGIQCFSYHCYTLQLPLWHVPNGHMIYVAPYLAEKWSHLPLGAHLRLKLQKKRKIFFLNSRMSACMTITKNHILLTSKMYISMTTEKNTFFLLLTLLTGPPGDISLEYFLLWHINHRPYIF